MVISKSEFMMFLRHPAWLWLKKYDKSKIPIPDEDLQARFDEGTLFEEYAEKLFPNAVKLGYKNNGEFSGSKYYALPESTKKELDSKTRVIMQGRVEQDNLTAIFDVLERVDPPAGGNTFNLYEIKSSTSVKPEHIPDLAFQTIVLEKGGLTIQDMYVLHVNNEYVKNGPIDPKGITKISKVTDEVRDSIVETEGNIEKAFAVLSKKEMPDISPRHLSQGSLEEWLEIFSLVKGDLPRYSIYKLAGISPKKIEELEDLGIELINDIPGDFALSEKQEKQVEATKSGEPNIDKEEIKEFLSTFEFPLYFFDYETMAGVIPVFDGTRPYQQVPFQYSLHIQETREGGLIHKEYLHTENTDPVLSLLKQMQEDFGAKGSVVSWYKQFEMARNNEMALRYPEFAPLLQGINDRMVDLMIPFSKGWFVDKDFFGSASLKAVLPVLVPELSYKELEVSHGGMAQRVWMETVLGGKNTETKSEIMVNLRKYCTLDTYAMYAIYMRLIELL
ncbi:MAG: hypothetical protein COV96_02710 [Candidatus Zambryskibacteria bacterium CG11_big_fil_rev_8_21_14_0_20_42_18]|uniref:DUF2779 domain-containing protein n=1 Tax=Candidatus Zambryskibacteria bacterium CG_4_9_14_3_um_filter_42_15 TaxID=1975112 RepID=A0A2M7WSG4_9BACT|nr:MAG: hypothetical protein COV96_02710 [Candidatus Zambryskibacteria bacterium CG11_big_fil_rev_8_21_14_0_20_42_18]PJA32945.1 MAG: hypothetical protein CO185_01185 [Candidatus Zambryskibacteria bacterium CG_4_9_14_3_um_filter_42_15]